MPSSSYLLCVITYFSLKNKSNAYFLHSLSLSLSLYIYIYIYIYIYKSVAFLMVIIIFCCMDVAKFI